MQGIEGMEQKEWMDNIKECMVGKAMACMEGTSKGLRDTKTLKRGKTPEIRLRHLELARN